MMTLLDALKNYLRENGYRSGEKIPTEMELAAHFNVSRSRIREATTTLCLQGILDKKARRGTVIRSMDPESAGSDLLFRFSLDNVDPADYLDIIDQNGAAVNVGMLAGHTYFRRCAGVTDRYSPATAAQRELINAGIDRALMRGCLGVSYGMRYSPGTNREEIIAAARPCCGSGKMIAAHIRSDAGGLCRRERNS